LKEGEAVRKLLRPAGPNHKEAIMDGSTGQTAAGRKVSAARTAGVTATAIALFAVAIFVGARRASDGPPRGLAVGPTVAEPLAAPAAAPATTQAPPPAAKHPPRHLQEVNRHELETTLPQGVAVDVTASAGDAEAYRLAEEIQAFLFLKGYRVGDVTRSVSTPMPKGVKLQPLTAGRWRVIVGSAED
jgi:hypothetical protein